MDAMNPNEPAAICGDCQSQRISPLRNALRTGEWMGATPKLNNPKKAPPALGSTSLSSETYVFDPLISYKQRQYLLTASTRSIVDLKETADKSVVSNNTVSTNRTIGSVNAAEIQRLSKKALHEYRQAWNERLVVAPERLF